MARRRAPNFAELRPKLVGMHGEERVQRAELRALLFQAMQVYELAGAMREAAEQKLDALVAELEKWREKEREWSAVVHGLMLQVGRDIDTHARPAGELEPGELELEPTPKKPPAPRWRDWPFAERMAERGELIERGSLRRRRRARRAGLRLLRRLRSA